MNPVVVWKVLDADLIEELARRKEFGFKLMAKGIREESLWDGDPTKIITPPFNTGYEFMGGLAAFVGQKYIGNVWFHSSTHTINHPPKMMLNAYSILHPQKKNGGYGKDFGDEEHWQTRQITKSYDLAAAKEYVEKPFLELLAETFAPSQEPTKPTTRRQL